MGPIAFGDDGLKFPRLRRGVPIGLHQAPLLLEDADNFGAALIFEEPKR